MEHIRKDITTIDRGVIAHGVNCQGVMNSGVARTIRNKWPIVYDTYSRLEPDDRLLGMAQIILVDNQNDIHVANCFTQETYGRNGIHADPEAIRGSLITVCQWAGMRVDNGIDTPIYLPQIGCGLGGLSWEDDVRPIVQEMSRLWPHLCIRVCTL